MKLSRKFLCGLLTVALTASVFTACGGDTQSVSSANGDNSGNVSDNVSDTQNSGNTSSDGSKEVLEAPSNGSVLQWLGYYDLNTDDKVIVEEFNEAGYTVEYIATQSGSIYFEKLAQLVASDTSPDMVRYEWMSFPHGISKNLYMPIGDYIDFESPTWSGISNVIENFNYGGKYYYIPYRISAGVVLIYNIDKKTLATMKEELAARHAGEAAPIAPEVANITID